MSDFAYPLHEECGVFGLYDRAGTEDVAAAAYSALYALQHRGQESCGIAVNDDGVIQGHRDLGLVNEVFTPAVLGSLANPNAHMATGHVRYATSGSRIRANAQPMIVRHGRGTMALCHNGNLTNAIELRRQLENEGAIFHGSSDTEVICYLITRNRLRMGSIETAISKTMDVLEGAYSLVIMSATKLIAVRDPRGYRPLCIGTLPGGGYVFASESCALDAVGATLLRDVKPGEIVVADAKTGELRSITDHVGRPDTQMCVFEFIYFARPDSIIEGSSVHEAESLQWMEEKPLFGAKILVTRPKRRSAGMAGRLREAGAEVVELPAAEPRLLEDTSFLDRTLERLADFRWAVFTSPSGVELFFEYLRREKKDIRLLMGLKFAVIGAGTAKALCRYGFYASWR